MEKGDVTLALKCEHLNFEYIFARVFLDLIFAANLSSAKKKKKEFVVFLLAGFCFLLLWYDFVKKKGEDIKPILCVHNGNPQK